MDFMQYVKDQKI